MKKYLSHFTAAYEWNIPCLNVIFSTKNIEKALNERGTEYTVTSPGARHNNKECTVHSSIMDLPRDAVVKKNNKLVASPELVFLQLANELDFHPLVLLGLQLCSCPPGNKQQAISSKRKLGTFIDKSSGHRGYRKAKHALMFMEDGAASITEAITFMVLTLPHSFGGYGLRGACFNQEISLDAKAKNSLGKNRCFVDIFYPEANLAVEYDSLKHHGNATAQGKDSIRSTTLKRLGIEVFHMTTIQLYEQGACKDFVVNLASRLGKRIRIRAKGFDSSHEKLRELLPRN